MKLFYRIFFYKRLFIAFGVCFFIFSSGCAKTADSSGLENSSYYVTKVIDGDTIELSNGWRIRYLGIDTPEVRRKVMGEWIYDPEPFALEAKNYNSQLVLNRKVRLEYDMEKKDKYDRLLAYVYVDQTMVNEELLRKGLARVLIIPPNGKYSVFFKEIQLSAKEKQLGIWSPE